MILRQVLGFQEHLFSCDFEADLCRIYGRLFGSDVGDNDILAKCKSQQSIISVCSNFDWVMAQRRSTMLVQIAAIPVTLRGICLMSLPACLPLNSPTPPLGSHPSHFENFWFRFSFSKVFIKSQWKVMLKKIKAAAKVKQIVPILSQYSHTSDCVSTQPLLCPLARWK